MKPELIFVTGYFGAPIRETAERMADEKGYELISLDDEIERADGRSVLRICMMMGEHEYRNKEYELLSTIVSDAESAAAGSAVDVQSAGGTSSAKDVENASSAGTAGNAKAAGAVVSAGSAKAAENTSTKKAVILCGDGVLHDEMSRDIIKKHSLIIVGDDMTRDELWENAGRIKDSYHAFMHFGSDESRRKAFDELYERQRKLYTSMSV